MFQYFPGITDNVYVYVQYIYIYMYMCVCVYVSVCVPTVFQRCKIGLILFLVQLDLFYF